MIKIIRHGEINIRQSVLGLLCALCAFFFLVGCGPAVSRQLREQVSEGLTLKVALKDPEACQGKTILWSGVIISSVNVKDGTMVEVLEKPANMQGRPKDVDESQGRFLTLYPGYLDVAIYSRGRKVTVGGDVQGKKIQRLGEIDYSYPLISAREIHLWPVEKQNRTQHYYCPYPYWYYPRWYYPYWYP
jgi:outer membrane lipoprotein